MVRFSILFTAMLTMISAIALAATLWTQPVQGKASGSPMVGPVKAAAERQAYGQARAFEGLCKQQGGTGSTQISSSCQKQGPGMFYNCWAVGTVTCTK